jgi:hypothetical protein
MDKIRCRLAGAVVAALAAVLAGCNSSGPAGSPRITADVTAIGRSCTEQVTLATATGQMRACVDYTYTYGRLNVIGAGASYASSSGYDLPYFSFAFRDPSSSTIGYKFSSPVVHAENVFSHNTGLITLAKATVGTDIHPGDVLQISLWATGAASGQVIQMASVTLTLYPRGLWCPDLGMNASYDQSTGQC